MTRFPLLLAVPLAAFVVVGCRDTANSAREDARKAAREAEEAARQAASDARDAARDASREARQAGREVQDALREAGREMRSEGREAAGDLHDAKQLLDVRAALAVSNEIGSAGDITVRTDEAGRVLYLEGSVRTPAEKAAAERIAREKADGLRVSNRLKVTSRR